MAKKATVEGFEEGGEFHPIRDSKGYSAKKAHETKSRGKSSGGKYHAAKSHRGGAGKLHGRKK